MRGLPLSITLALAAVWLAACGGADSKSEPTPTHVTASATAVATTVATAAGAASPTAAPSSAPSPTSAASPSPSAEAATPTAAPPTATNPPAANTPVATQPPAPTATPAPAGGNPMSAFVGATGTVRFFWSPSAVKVAPGGTVTWSWNEPVQPHNVSGTDFPLSSAATKAGSASYTFSTPGVYHFTCDIHPDTMTGTVTVQ